MTIDFKGHQYPKSVILYAVFSSVRYGVSYRDLEEIMAERGVEVDHATLNRWVVKFSPMIAANAQVRKKPTAISWRIDETYIKVRGKWTYLCRAVDTNGVPERIAIDKSRESSRPTEPKRHPQIHGNWLDHQHRSIQIPQQYS